MKPPPRPAPLSIPLPVSDELVAGVQRALAAVDSVRELYDAVQAIRRSPEGQAIGALVTAARRRRVG